MKYTPVELLHFLGLFVARRVGELDHNGRRASLHGLRVMHRLDRIDGTLSLEIGDERTPATLHVGVAQHRAVLDLTIRCEHHAYVLLLARARDHADEEFAFVAVLRVRWFHLYRMMHAWECDQIVQGVLRIQRRLASVKGHETTALVN